MNIRTAIWAAAFAAILGALGPQARGDVSVSFGFRIHAVADFYDPLSSLGAWVDIGPYGRCWHPNDIGPDWRPYTDGAWEYTDAGWCWVSDEPFAWACYHYGSWVNDPSHGWCWIPATDWAPAWVTWRYSDDYVGWAPCGPRETEAPARDFVFVDAHHFHDPIRRGSLIVNNSTIINRTTVVHNFPHERRTVDGVAQTIVADPGPPVDRIQRATGAKFTPRPIQEVMQRTAKPKPANQNTQASRTPEQRPAEQAQPQRRAIQEPAGAGQEPSSAERRVIPGPPAAQSEAPEQRRISPQEKETSRTFEDRGVRQPAGPPPSQAPAVEHHVSLPAPPSKSIADRPAREPAAPQEARSAESKTIREPAGAERPEPVAPERKAAAPPPSVQKRETPPPHAAAPASKPESKAPPETEKKKEQQ